MDFDCGTNRILRRIGREERLGNLAVVRGNRVLSCTLLCARRKHLRGFDALPQVGERSHCSFQIGGTGKRTGNPNLLSTGEKNTVSQRKSSISGPALRAPGAVMERVLQGAGSVWGACAIGICAPCAAPSKLQMSKGRVQTWVAAARYVDLDR